MERIPKTWRTWSITGRILVGSDSLPKGEHIARKDMNTAKSTLTSARKGIDAAEDVTARG